MTRFLCIYAFALLACGDNPPLVASSTSRAETINTPLTVNADIDGDTGLLILKRRDDTVFQITPLVTGEGVSMFAGSLDAFGYVQMEFYHSPEPHIHFRGYNGFNQTPHLLPGAPREGRVGGLGNEWESFYARSFCDTIGAPLASAATLNLVEMVHAVSGSEAISTIVLPSYLTGLTDSVKLRLLPTGPFTLVTGGNIAKATIAEIGRTLELTWDGAGLWYPNY